MESPGPWGVSMAPNITAGAEGIGKFSDEDLAAVIQHGVRRGRERMMPPMPYPTSHG